MMAQAPQPPKSEMSLAECCTVFHSANMPRIRKKYRKMRVKFDAKMHESNTLCAKEQLGADTAKRIAQENELAEPPESFTIPSDCSAS